MPMTTPFRRGIQADAKRSGGRGRRGNFYEQLKVTGNYTPILLMNAEYLDLNPSQDEIEIDPATGRPRDVKKPYFKFLEHTRNIMQNGKERYPKSVCSAGNNPHNPQPCAGCAAVDSGDRSIGPASMQVSIGLVHLAVYHRHPIIDKKTGGIVMKQSQQGKPQEQLLVDDECQGRTCNFCRVLQGQPPINDPQNPWPGYRPQDISTFFGKRRYLKMGKNHLQNMLAWDAQVSGLCGNDNTELVTDGFKCPTCQTMVIDFSQDTRTNEQIAEAVARPYPCLRCQRPVLLEEVVGCPTCEAANRQYQQYSMFNRVLWIYKQGEQTASQLLLHRHESVQEFFARVPPQLMAGKTHDQLLKDLMQPYDFAKLFEPRSYQDQLKDLGYTDRQGQAQGGPAYPQQGGMVPQGYGAPGMGYGPPGYPQQGPNYGAQPGMAPPPGAFPPPAGPGMAPPGVQPGFGPPPAAPGFGPPPPAPMVRPNYGSGGQGGQGGQN